MPDGFLIRRDVAQQAAQDADGGEQQHGHQLAVEHRGNGNQHAGQQTGDVAAQHPHHQAAFEAEIERLVRVRVDDARRDAGAEDDGAHQRHLHALGKRPFLPHQHALETAAARENAGERSRHGELHQQDHQVLLDHR